MYKKYEHLFFDRGSIGEKSEVNVEKHPRAAELKVKMLNV